MPLMSDAQKTTDFGFQSVPVNDKAKRVAEVFQSVAQQYDLMNDLMSFGLHRIWKNLATDIGQFKKGQTVLDLAGGTGDLTKRISPLVGDSGHVILSDINHAMLSLGRDNLLNAGLHTNTSVAQINAEQLPFQDNQFDRIVIGFGLRNVTDKNAALRAMYRCLKPGGKLIVLEFSKPTTPGLKPLYDAYSFKVLPWLGKHIANDSASYQYLAESIRMHPDQNTLKSMLEDAAFEDCAIHNLCGGITAIHTGYKY